MIRRLGDFGEKVIVRAFPRMRLRQQPGSGNRWPRQEDLEGPRHLVQVKTTRASDFLDAWLSLYGRAAAEGKNPKWYEIVITANEREAVIFERRMVKIVDLGVGGGG